MSLPFQYKIYTVDKKNISADASQTYKLSEEQLRFYKDNGYLVIKELIDFTTLYACKQHFIQISKGLVPRGFITITKTPFAKPGVTGEDAINKIQELLYDDIFCGYSENPRLLDVVSQIIGPNIMGVHFMFINKPPGSGVHPPHQDLHYFPFRPADRIVAAWTAVDHISEENGCLFVVPGSHRSPLYDHDYPKDKDGRSMKIYHGILDPKVAPEEARVPLVMAPGDTVFFHPLLVHGSGANTSERYRKSLSCHYAASECSYIDVRGTSQEKAAVEIEAIAAQKGVPISIQGLRSMTLAYCGSGAANDRYDHLGDDNDRHQLLYVLSKDVWRYRSKLVRGVKCNL